MNEKQHPAVGGKYLTFSLGAEEYGVRIEHVHEIIALLPITRIPRAPDVVLGVINLRGKIVPVFDMHRKFGMRATASTRHTCIIVVGLGGTSVGIVVDQVREVVTIAAASIEPAPSFPGNVPTDHLVGIATSSGGGARLLLAIERVLASNDVKLDAPDVDANELPEATAA